MSGHKKIQDAIDSNFIEQRKVFLWGQVDDDSAKHVVDRLMYLDALGTEDITLYINSPGGYVTSGFAIYDCIKSLKSEVSTVCTGFAASMGSLILSAGQKGKRFIQPHARVMIHQPSGKELSAQILADNCGQTFEKVMKDFNRDHWMGADESVAYGIVDQVAK